MAVAVGSPLVYRQKWAFVVTIDTVTVGGFDKAGPLKQSVTMNEHRQGGSPFVVDYTPDKFKQEKVTLSRGSSNNVELWNWWDACRSGVLDRRGVFITSIGGDGSPLTVWSFPNSYILEFEAGEFDAKNDTENVVEKLVLQPYYLDRTFG